MKKYLPLIFLTAALTGCNTVYVPTIAEVPVRPINVDGTSSVNEGYRLSNSHYSDVAKIRFEATRLSDQVGKGQITKVQAAQYLNRYRIQLVGKNPVDDNVYEVYLRAAVDSQRGAITTEQSKLYIQNALKGWQQRWPNMTNKPTNPAFTNFLMELMNMQPLQ